MRRCRAIEGSLGVVELIGGKIAAVHRGIRQDADVEVDAAAYRHLLAVADLVVEAGELEFIDGRAKTGPHEVGRGTRLADQLSAGEGNRDRFFGVEEIVELPLARVIVGKVASVEPTALPR